MLERAIDMFAADIGLDPAEVRRQELHPQRRVPVHRRRRGANYDIGDYDGALDRCSSAPATHELRAEQAAPPRERDLAPARDRPERLRRGHQRDQRGASSARSRSPPTARRSSSTGSFSQGQGHETTFAHDRRRAAGHPDREDHGAQGRHRRGRARHRAPTARSRPRSAAWPPARRPRRSSRSPSGWPPTSSRRAPRTWCSTSSRALPRRRLAAAALSWGELAGALEQRDRLAELSAEVDFQPPQPTFPFGAHVARRRGRHRDRQRRRCMRMVAVDDAGTDHQPAGRRGPGPRRRCRRASPRRCSRRSPTTRTATLRTPTWSPTCSRRAPSSRSSSA